MAILQIIDVSKEEAEKINNILEKYNTRFFGVNNLLTINLTPGNEHIFNLINESRRDTYINELYKNQLKKNDGKSIVNKLDVIKEGLLIEKMNMELESIIYPIFQKYNNCSQEL